MDNCNNLTVADTGLPGGAAIDSIASSGKNLAANIRNRAKAKKAQKISDAGGYNTLTPFQKSLIPVPAYALNKTTPTAQDAKEAEPTAVQTGAMTKFLPYIAGVIILALAFYFFRNK
jgi:hypothetical protein